MRLPTAKFTLAISCSDSKDPETLSEIDALGCDYPCFFDHLDSAFYTKLAVYYASTLVVWAVEHAESSGYIDCTGATPLRASGAPAPY